MIEIGQYIYIVCPTMTKFAEEPLANGVVQYGLVCENRAIQKNQSFADDC